MSRDQLTADLLRQLARQLKSPAIARNFEQLARQAREEGLTHEEYLAEVLRAEADSREASAVRERIREARFPEEKSLGAFDFDASGGLDRAVIAHLARGEWLRKRHNILVAGTIGTGKTHIAIALGHEAARQRHHVAFWRTADLVQKLVEAKDQRELGRFQKRLARLDLLILDELGFVPFDRTGGELLFNVLAERYERRSVLITTNLAFAEWPRVFGGDEKLAAAALDRLAHHSTVLTTSGPSYRSRVRAKANAERKAGDNTPDRG
jgi:DNA replication protein DnaC